MNWAAVILAFIGGLAISFVNFIIMRIMLKKGAEGAGAMSVRTVVMAGFFVALFFIAKALEIELIPFLIAGAIGATIGLVVFSVVMTRKP